MPGLLANTPHAGSWGVYLLLRGDKLLLGPSSQGSRDTYVGMTNRMPFRLKAHNMGKVRATAGSQWKLIAFLPCDTRAQAAILERWLKTGDSHHKRLLVAGWAAQPGDSAAITRAFIIRAALKWHLQRTVRHSLSEAQAGA